MLVFAEYLRLAFFLLNRYWANLSFEKPDLLCSGPAQLTAEREGVLIGTRDSKLACDVFSRVRHGVDAIALLHQRVDKSPSDRRVFDLGASRERRVRLGKHE